VIYRDFINLLNDDEDEGDIETQQAIQASLQEVDNAAVTIESTSPDRSVWKKIGLSYRNDQYHYGHLMHMYHPGAQKAITISLQMVTKFRNKLNDKDVSRIFLK